MHTIYNHLHLKGKETTRVYTVTELSTVIKKSNTPTALVVLQVNQSVILIPNFHLDHWFLAVVFTRTERIYFLDILENDERILFYSVAIPAFLNSHLNIMAKESWKYD